MTQLSLWPNGGEGVFMVQSGLLSQSGATQDSLRGPYYKHPSTYTYRYTHTYTHTHTEADTHTPVITQSCPLDPSTLHFVMCLHQGPLPNLSVSGLTFIETPNCCELFPISLNWSVKSQVYSESK